MAPASIAFDLVHLLFMRTTTTASWDSPLPVVRTKLELTNARSFRPAERRGAAVWSIYLTREVIFGELGKAAHLLFLTSSVSVRNWGRLSLFAAGTPPVQPAVPYRRRSLGGSITAATRLQSVVTNRRLGYVRTGRTARDVRADASPSLVLARAGHSGVLPQARASATMQTAHRYTIRSLARRGN
jgi:hypothetical protein